ncbi:MAG: ABC transporter permease [Planctomycetota bacterium]|jgi:ABC-2 type transport system permease protein|nr:ABC transporter permease [Planctomycetota bacterium]
MRSLVIARREFMAYFESPIGYFVVALFPALAAALFFLVGDLFFSYNEASLRHFFANMPILTVIVVPAIAMRTWSEELRSGTIERLSTLPFSLGQMVVGKFLGVWAVFIFALICTLLVPITVDLLGDLDWGPVIAAYLGTTLMAGAALAVCCFFSATTTNQIVAWLLGACVLLVFNLIHLIASAAFVPRLISELVLQLDFSQHYASLSRGVIDLGAVVYFTSIAVFFLAANAASLMARRCR